MLKGDGEALNGQWGVLKGDEYALKGEGDAFNCTEEMLEICKDTQNVTGNR